MKLHQHFKMTSLIKTMIFVFVITCSLFSTTKLLALSVDAEQAIEIEADFFELDDKKGLTVYSGNVIVNQGSLQMSGDKLSVSYDENQQLNEVLMDGKPARFKQQADGTKEWTKGQGRRMEYYPKKELLLLLTNAKVSQGAKMFSGDRIEYDIEKSRVRARGTKTTAGSKDGKKSGGRVKIVIPAKKKSK